KACQAAGIQPILGCEVNVARTWASTGARPGDEAVDHLVLLATSDEGYRSLVRIVSEGHVEPASSLGPSVTLATVEKHKAGLVGLTGCMGGVVAQRILEHGEEAGRGELDRLRACFEPGALYVEL